MRLRVFVACFGVVLTFSLGVAVGQKAASSRFEKYEGPARRSEMDMRLLEANLLLIREQLLSAPGIGIPRLFYGRGTRKVVAVAFVDEKFLGQQKTDEVKKNLEITVGAAFIAAGVYLPELQWADPDFEVEFVSVPDFKKGDIRIGKESVYAEYKNGEMTIY